MVIIGIRLQTWTRVIVNRCIGKIIARDLSLVASWLYRMAVTRPQSRVAVTLSLSLGADLLGCITVQEKRKGKERKDYTFLPRTYSYEIISAATDWYSSMATFRRIRCTGKLHLHWLVVKTHADAICTGPWSKEEKKRREKQETIQKWSRPPLSQLPNPCSNYHHSRSSYISV